MSTVTDHPAIQRCLEAADKKGGNAGTVRLESESLRRMCIDFGADDAGFVEISRPELAVERDEILQLVPWTKTLVSIVGRLNRENLRSPARSIASIELHQTGKRLTDAASQLASALERMNVRAVTPAVGFPMEMGNWLGRMYAVSHKPVAVAAGLGHMGLHRNVIHPRFGSFVLLNTVLIDAALDAYSAPLAENPCIGCKLCASACPTGAIAADGFYNPVNCLTHTYRELVGGFTDWVENVAESKHAIDYRRRVSDAETVSLWQSLANGPCYKSVYCMAVCPAGDDVLPQYLADRKKFIDDVVGPLRKKEETVYVLPGSDAELHVQRVFPHKKIKRVGNGVRPPSIASFLAAMPRAFQRLKSEGLNATYHFTFSGAEILAATVVIKGKTISVYGGHTGEPDVLISADAKTWLRVMHKESSMVKEIVFRRIRIKGPMKLFKAFGKCFA